MKKKFLLGLAAILLPWAAWAQDTEGNGDFIITLDQTEWTYTGNAIAPSVTVTSEKEGSENMGSMYEITYKLVNGNNPEGTPVGKGTIKDAGVYTVTVTPTSLLAAAGWQASSTTFIVKPKQLTKVSVKSLTKKYGIDDVEFDIESLETADGALAGDELENAENCLTFEVVGNKTFEQAQQANAGEKFEVKISGKDNAPETTTSNYYYAPGNSGNVTAELVITQRDLTVVLKNSTKEYNGGNTSLATMNANANNRYFTIEGDGVKDGDDVKVTLAGSKGESGFRNVGNYTINVSIDEASQTNYNLTTETLNYTITQAEMTIAKKKNVEDLKVTFGESKDVTTNFDLGFASNEKSSSDYTVVATLVEGTTEGVNGTYQALIYYKNEQVSKMSEEEQEQLNYYFTYVPTTPETVEVEAKSIADNEDVEIEITDLTYQGAKFDATKTIKNEAGEDEHIIVVTLGETPLEYGVDYELKNDAVEAAEEDGTATDAGEKFNVTITGKGNYTGTATLENQTIEKATLKITPKTESETVKFSKDYDGVAVGELRDNFDMTFVGETDSYENVKLADGTVVELTMGVESTLAVNAGNNKEIYAWLGADNVVLNENKNTKALKNYDIEFPTAYYTINKRKSAFSIAKAEKTYDGTTSTPEKGFTFTFTNPAGTGDAVETAAKIFDTDKAPTIILDSEEDAKNVGSYALKLDEKDVDDATEGTQLWVSSNYELTYVGPTENLYTINQADMNIQIQDKAKSVEFGCVVDGELIEEILNTWIKGKATYVKIGMDLTIQGYQADADMARTMMAFQLVNGAESGESGFYKNGLVVKVEENENWSPAQKLVWQNYKITEGIADLTIKGIENTFVLDGDAEETTLVDQLNQYDGATFNGVEIKNMKNFVTSTGTISQKIFAGRWYTLVLPFDIKVRDLSPLFGYAIVNVPDESKGSKGAGYFRLEMGEIPANTLMAFKVDEDIDWDADKVVTFEKSVKIVAPTDTWTTDAAGNQFIGVYETQPVTGDDNYVLWPFEGKFYQVSSLWPNGLEIHPLNGYIHFNEPGTAGARIYMEELDGSTTAIDAVTGETISNATAEGWYTIGGVKLNGEPTEKGVYINNGKKVVIK